MLNEIPLKVYKLDTLSYDYSLFCPNKLYLIFLEFDKQMFVHYSTVILSFLGAVYWGVYLQSKNVIAILFSVCPAIYAFFVLSFDLKFDEGVMAKVAEKKRKEAEFAETVRAELARESKFFAERMVCAHFDIGATMLIESII